MPRHLKTNRKYKMRKRWVNIFQHLKEIDYILTNGCTNPVKGRLNTNEIVIAKVFNNEQGNLTLVNEYISYKLALALRLPVVKSGICLYNTSTIDSNNCISFDNYGPCFYSTYLEKSAPLKVGIIRLLSNIDTFYSLLLFDHIIYNKDRNIYNLLTTYTKADISFRLIDHSHVFKNETLWDANCFKIGMSEFDIYDTDILTSNHEMYSMFLQSMSFEKEKLYNVSKIFKETITSSMLNSIICEIPIEWNLRKTDSSALVEYLLYRLENITSICDMICKHWNIL